ncbi:Homeobox-leucine zipper protein ANTHOCYANINLESS 2, variant 3 [Lathyrus oleraceus]|uniref:Homeobox-leucine zipper protein ANTHOCYANINLESS 2, variant 3 n=1 Tax=Pisum sativum TaxID=3888 RepID=A0A9D5B0A2_PEA|nr:Homeobox-leucine zipper protein ANTHOCYANINLESS 2, variant 3 [Pisum sativum]
MSFDENKPGCGESGKIISEADINAFSNGTNHSSSNNITIMPSGAISQPRLSTPTSVKSMFNSPGLSLALQTNNGLRRNREEEEEHESRSGGSENMDGVSGDDFDAADNPPRKKRYHRHTPQQIQELESMFKECPHPDEKQRLELSKRLCLETRQVKFWFQNRRTQMKVTLLKKFTFLSLLFSSTDVCLYQTQLERHDNSLLRQANDKLRAENMSIREAMRNPMCSNCGEPAIINEISLEEQHLRIENARLKDELDRVCTLAGKFLGRPITSLQNSNLDIGFVGLNNNTLPLEQDFGISMERSMVTNSSNGNGFDRSMERSMFLELALSAMDELVKMAQTKEPLWIKSVESGREILNHEEYSRTVGSSCIGLKPNGFVSEASRESGVVIINSLALVETLMDSNRWSEMFPCVIAKASTSEVISNGINGTRNGALQLVYKFYIKS